VVPSVLAIKRVTDRGAPNSRLPPEQTVPLFGPQPPGAYADGYPGGHAVNTVVWYGVLLVVVTALLHAYGRTGPPRAVRLAVRLAPPAIVLVVSTYLSFHWLTDGLAGLAIGLAIDRLLYLARRVPSQRWRGSG
jgi:membrane-associated phospholipid phosphatase